MESKNYYEKYDTVLQDPYLNPTFETILGMDKIAFRDWVTVFRQAVVREWDVNNQPPRVGYDRADIIDNFVKLKDHKLNGLLIEDDLTKTVDVIRNTTTLGNACNQWFPTMMKTRITYSSKISESKSIYDYFADPGLLNTFETYAHRHFHRDSFYHYSNPVSTGDLIGTGTMNISTEDAESFMIGFEGWRDNLVAMGFDYFLCPVKEDKVYTGYNVALKTKKNLIISEADLKKIENDIPMHCRTNVDYSRWNTYSIRIYNTGQHIFPVGLKAFRVSFCQYAVNFPPLTARFLYERYTKHLRTRVSPSGDACPIIVYDPSSGWGGRLLGAMSSNSDVPLLYVGTDPNTDHNITDGKSKYHSVAGFFNRNVLERSPGLFPTYGHAYHIFQEGSEEINKHPDFQQYRGAVDLVFTSPPYFAKEVYSDDPAQSCHKFSDYAKWRDGFLKPTIETAVEWLRPGGYLLWNVSDIVMAGTEHPLVQDSIDIVTSLGLTHTETLKLALAQMPGGNRLEETGDFEEVEEHTLYETTTKKIPVMKGKMKYFCEVRKESGKGKMFLKYEPILVFHKPL